MQLSARNQFHGTVLELRIGAVGSTVKIDIGNNNIVTSSITKDAVEELGLTKGDKVTVIIKSSDVMIAK